MRTPVNLLKCVRKVFVDAAAMPCDLLATPGEWVRTGELLVTIAVNHSCCITAFPTSRLVSPHSIIRCTATPFDCCCTCEPNVARMVNKVADGCKTRLVAALASPGCSEPRPGVCPATRSGSELRIDARLNYNIRLLMLKIRWVTRVILSERLS